MMKRLLKGLIPLATLAAIGLFNPTPITSAKTVVHKGAPSVLKGSWVTKVKKIPGQLLVKGANYQRAVWYVGKHGTDETSLFYLTKHKPAKLFNAAGGGVNSRLKYIKKGHTYYLTSHDHSNYFHYKATVLSKKRIKLSSSINKKVTKWHYLGKYYKQANHIVEFTTKTKIKY
ncbi:hypothetical protein [Nicoliella lavandulae]|uniref:Uncharacterized protein n=1 Tax=Nicoliella lavandulae TaxID=3082954 RepID=A0ABU8SLR5_9LACO